MAIRVTDGVFRVTGAAAAEVLGGPEGAAAGGPRARRKLRARVTTLRLDGTFAPLVVAEDRNLHDE